MERIQNRPREIDRNREPGKFHLFLLALLSLSMAIFLLFHFTCIWLYGRFYICEPTQWILIIETCLISGIIVFCVYCLVEQLKR